METIKELIGRLIISLICMTGMLLLCVSNVSALDPIIEAGYIDSVGGIFEVVSADDEDLVVIKIKEDREIGVGKLLLVDERGAVKNIRGYYKDKSGLIVKQVTNLDKAIFVDNYGFIVGGVNLSQTEVSTFVYKNALNEKVASLYAKLNRSRVQVLDAFRTAADVLDEARDLAEEDKADLYLATIAMNAGLDIRDVAAQLIEVAAERGEVVLHQYADSEEALVGVDLVADSGNGGFGGYVMDSGNGGFGGLVMDSGNGGFGGYVMDSGNGGFGGYVMDSGNGGFGGCVKGLGIDGDLLLKLK